MDGRRIAAAAALILCSCEAAAQRPARAVDAAARGSAARVVEGFSACRAIADPSARLDCFDKAAASLEAAVRAKDVRIVDRQDIRTARRSLFGFTLPRIALFGGGDGTAEERREEAEFTAIDTIVISARIVENSRVEFRINEGDALWRTTDPMGFAPRSGAKVRIRKGALGNYFVSFAGERTVRGMRLR